jgi:hypothetical protein
VPSLVELELVAVLDHCGVNLLEPGDLRLRERRVGEICKRRPAPEFERSRKRLLGFSRPPVRLLLTPRCNEAFELSDIELLGLDPERVAVRASLYSRA